MENTHRLEQTPRRGRRLSILGLWQPLVTFVYGLAIGSFTSVSYIKMMNEQAHLAAQEFAKTGRIRVIVQDNGSIHTSTQVQQQWSLRGGSGSLPILFASLLLGNEPD